MIHDFIPNLIAFPLIVIFNINSTILEHSVLHFHIIKQTILWVKFMEESILIVYGHSLSWNVSVILETSASLGESNDALA